MQIGKRQFTETKKLDTFGNKVSYTDITEYSVILDKNMSEKAFIDLLAENGIKLYGYTRYFVKKLTNFDIETMTKKVQFVFIAQEMAF